MILTVTLSHMSSPSSNVIMRRTMIVCFSPLLICFVCWHWFRTNRAETANVELQNLGFEILETNRYGLVYCFHGKRGALIHLEDIPNVRYLSSIDSILYDGFEFSSEVWASLRHTPVRTVMVLNSIETDKHVIDCGFQVLEIDDISEVRN